MHYVPVISQLPPYILGIKKKKNRKIEAEKNVSSDAFVSVLE